MFALSSALVDLAYLVNTAVNVAWLADHFHFL